MNKNGKGKNEIQREPKLLKRVGEINVQNHWFVFSKPFRRIEGKAASFLYISRYPANLLN